MGICLFVPLTTGTGMTPRLKFRSAFAILSIGVNYKTSICKRQENLLIILEYIFGGLQSSLV